MRSRWIVISDLDLLERLNCHPKYTGNVIQTVACAQEPHGIACNRGEKLHSVELNRLNYSTDCLIQM